MRNALSTNTTSHDSIPISITQVSLVMPFEIDWLGCEWYSLQYKRTDTTAVVQGEGLTLNQDFNLQVR